VTIGHGKYANPRDGDVIEMDVDVRDDRVTVTGMSLRSCDAGTRAAKELASWAHGMSPEDAALIEPRALITRLRLGADEARCALTTVAAFRAALIDARVNKLLGTETRARP
jgi:NifU-like protein involved in Fe-S cluster formation